MFFRFNIRDGAELVPDEQGMILPDIESARDEARRNARELMTEAYAATHAIERRVIEIVDPQGRVVDTLAFRSVLH